MICSGWLSWFFHDESGKLPLGWRGKIIFSQKEWYGRNSISLQKGTEKSSIYKRKT